jgi:LmbE family N-acetylglucosaminyl deacetylase
MTNRNLALLLLFGTMISCSAAVDKDPFAGKLIVAVFAHPDDETALGGALAKLAREAEVHLVIVTDGRYGVTEHARIPAGEELVAIRSNEAMCSTERFGLASLRMLGAHDGLGMIDGIREYFVQMRTLRNDLTSTLESLQPDVIVTFGPDGDTGHADHRIVSALVTELRLQGVPSSNPEVLYLSWTQEQAALYHDWGLAHVATPYLDLQISFTEADEEQSLEAIRCYESQFSAREIEQWMHIERGDTANVRHFRRLRAQPSR